ncbi:hypothetical protein CEP53_012947 [Fusarium sp. AF-6]|nr:hypothetical protein CEP53_012947 [Fusarium sp. AF-6]
MVQIFFGFVIMFNNVIPLSLYVGLEGIKLGQMNLINNDVNLYDDRSDTPARVHATNNLDDLGQIGYLFTDKTGTLTDNIMNLRKACSPDELALVRAAQEMGFLVVERSPESIKIHITDTANNTERLEFQILDVVEFSSKRKRMSIIVRCPDGSLWLICKGANSVILPRLAKAPRDMIDELEEVSDLAGHADRGDQEWLEMSQGTPEDYARNRDSGGAPSARDDMIPLRQNIRAAGNIGSFRQGTLHGVVESAVTASDEEAQCIRQSFAHMDRYAIEGLRTLVYAGRSVSEGEYQDWKRLYHQAETSLHHRQERIEQVGEMMEQSLHFLGVSAVEDKLQQHVPETIEKLRRAQVKIWMLTGDKRETAISIAHSARICGPSTSLYVLDVTAGDLELQLTSIADTILYGAEPPTHSAVVINGATLTAIEKDPASRLRRLFYQLAPNIRSVICCRASPSQKALLVRVIGNNPLSKVERGRFSWLRPWSGPRRPLTLAIGDGANDVPMILTASVGVGISGREGQQASRVADFSISQFRFLARFMLVHGRWNYYRTTRFILVTLYHSQALMFTSYLTAAVILVIGMYEQDLKADTLLAVPELILEMHHKTKIALWSAFGSILGVWLYLLITAIISGYEPSPYAIKGGMIKEYGRDPSWWFALLYTLGLLIAAESTFKSLRQNAMVRALVVRCGSWLGIAFDSGKGIREGFNDWDPHLWQEMEKDKGVRRRLRDLGNGRKRHKSRSKTLRPL